MSGTATRTSTSARNIVSGWIGTLITLASGLIAMPWILRWLGSERFGAYRVLLDCTGYLILLDLGIEGSLRARLAPKLGIGDSAGVFQFLAAGLRAFLRISVAMLAAGAGFVLFLPRFLAAGAIGAEELRAAICILLVPTLWLPLSVFRTLEEARQRGYVINLLFAIQSVLISIFYVAAARAGWGLPGQAAAVVAAQIPAVAILTRTGLRRYPGVLRAQAQPTAVAAVWALSWPTLLFNLSGRAGLLSDNFLIGWLLGPAAVSRFFLTQRLASFALGQLQAFGNATWAGLVELHAQGHNERFQSRLLDLTTLVSCLGMAVLGPICAYNPQFLSLWLGTNVYAGEPVNLLVCVNVWLWSLTSLWSWPLSGTGHMGQWAPYAVLFTVVNLTVSIVATRSLNIAGPLIGTLAGFLFVYTWAMPRVLAKVYQVSPGALWRSALTPLIWGLPYAGLLWFVARHHTPRGWLGLALQAGLSGIGGLLLAWSHLGAEGRDEWRARLRSALAR